MKRTVKGTLTVAVIIIVAVAMLVCASVIVIISGSNIKTGKKNEIQLNADKYAQSINSWIEKEKGLNIAAATALAALSSDGYSSENIQNIVTVESSERSNLLNLYYGTEDKAFYQTDPNAEAPDGYDPTARGWYKSAKAENGTILPFTLAKNYFFKNNQELPTDPKIRTSSQFEQLFGRAAFMGKEGEPTPIDFSKQFAIAIVMPVTDRVTEIVPVELRLKDDKLYYSYEINEKEKTSYQMQPLSIIVLDKKYEDKDLLLNNKQLMQANMEAVQAYLKACGAFFIATNESGNEQEDEAAVLAES